MTELLEVRGAIKSFGAVRALTGVDLTLHEGEVLALLGDNGAGKSTLIKCIGGIHRLDAGEILFQGRKADIRNPMEARNLGIEMVYQDLAVFDNLTAPQNFYAGRELRGPRWMGRLGTLRERQMTESTREILARLEVGIPDLGAKLALMSGGQRQAIAVARAVAFASRVAILDEPTAALGVRESRTVLELIRRLVAHGTAIILISHNLDQVMQIADRAVIMRQGRVVGEAIPTRENHARLVSLIVGADIPD